MTEFKMLQIEGEILKKIQFQTHNSHKLTNSKSKEDTGNTLKFSRKTI